MNRDYVIISNTLGIFLRNEWGMAGISLGFEDVLYCFVMLLFPNGKVRLRELCSFLEVLKQIFKYAKGDYLGKRSPECRLAWDFMGAEDL